jgi:hypothetical protein
MVCDFAIVHSTHHVILIAHTLSSAMCYVDDTAACQEGALLRLGTEDSPQICCISTDKIQLVFPSVVEGSPWHTGEQL